MNVRGTSQCQATNVPQINVWIIEKREKREPNLIINHLLRFIVPFQHRDKLHNIRIISVELISRPIETHDQHLPGMAFLRNIRRESGTAWGRVHSWSSG